MLPATKIHAGLILLLHVYIVLLEMVFFKTRGWRVFDVSVEHVALMVPAMLNQSVCNGFLMAALALGLGLSNSVLANAFTWYGLGGVAVAGIWGAITVERRILFIQTVLVCAVMMALYLASCLVGCE